MARFARRFPTGAASGVMLLAACTSPRAEIEPFRLSECVALTDQVRQARLVEMAQYATPDPGRFETRFIECPDTYEIRTVPRSGDVMTVHEIDKATGTVRTFERPTD